MNPIKRILFLILLNIIAVGLHAQDSTQKVEMADTMRSNGRIYVVVAVILTILVGLVLYIVRLDRKISRMEKHSRS
jgi:fucose 4-O-acetylase-like acetyltransferase